MAEMTLVRTQPRTTAVVRGRVPRQDVRAFLARAFEMVAETVARQGVHVTGPPVTVYRGLDAGELDVEAGFPVAAEIAPADQVGRGELPGGRTVEAVQVGPYETLARTYAEIEDWLRLRGLRAAAPPARGAGIWT